jgi:hypothetical protein
MIEMLIGLLMTAVERTCLVEAEHPLVIEAQQVTAANNMAGVIILAWGSSDECRLFIASHPQPADMAEGPRQLRPNSMIGGTGLLATRLEARMKAAVLLPFPSGAEAGHALAALASPC